MLNLLTGSGSGGPVTDTRVSMSRKMALYAGSSGTAASAEHRVYGTSGLPIQDLARLLL